MKILLLPLLIASAFIFSCKPNRIGPSPVCTMEAKAGINLSIKDAKTNVFLGDSVVAILTDGTYTESLSYFAGNPPIFSGAWERTGSYVITISRNRYTTLTTSPIIVTKDECHVIPQTLTLSLQPKKNQKLVSHLPEVRQRFKRPKTKTTPPIIPMPHN